MTPEATKLYSIDLFLNVLKRNDSIIREDTRYWPGYYGSTTSNVTAKAFDYIPRLIQYKMYHHESDAHRLYVSQMHPVAKYLVFDVPKMMFKDFFRFENDKGKEIMPEKVHMLKDMGAKETLTLAAAFERLDGYSFIVYFDSEDPRYDFVDEQGVEHYRYDSLTPGAASSMRAFRKTSVTVLNTDLTGLPQLIEVEVDLEPGVKKFTVDKSRFTLVRTRPYDTTYKGADILKPIWDYLVLDTWATFNMGERMAREGSGYKHVQFDEDLLKGKTTLTNLAKEFRGLSSSKGAFTTNKVVIDEKGYGHNQVSWNINTDVLLDRMAIGSGYPKDILKGIQSGRVTGGEVNEKGVYSALNECQVDMDPVVKDMCRKCFSNMKQKFYNIKHNLTFRMTEKDRAETDKIKAETRNIELGWKDVNEIRDLENLPPKKEEKKPPIMLTNVTETPNLPQQKPLALPPPSKDEKQDLVDPIVDGAVRNDYFDESVGGINANKYELITPVVLAREGVLKYDEHKTKEFVSYDELVKAAKFSPSLPIILDSHHTMNVTGMDIQYGVITNIRGDNKSKKLVGEAHFFIDKTPKEYLDLLRDKKKIEGSIGKYIGAFGGSGEYLGECYDAEQKDIKMIHYAVSNKFIGKCSVRDGCGINQT